jgi:flagellar basal-body rod protein FlgF
MIYGLYLSASGVLANSYKQDVIANNLANAETVGFKKDLAVFRDQPTEARHRGLNPRQHSNIDLEGLGGGLSVAPTATDMSQGDLESGGKYDMAIQGDGFFAVRQGNQVRLTRDGRFAVNRDGNLALLSTGQEVLDEKRQAIPVNSTQTFSVGPDGAIQQGATTVGKIGVFDVAKRSGLVKEGRGLFKAENLERQMMPGTGEVRSGMVERANVEPTTELSALMDAQRLLEANANMIRYQDATLNRLVNDVGKIG